jgi:hypothetical protein
MRFSRENRYTLFLELPSVCLNMIFSENRIPLFGIML